MQNMAEERQKNREWRGLFADILVILNPGSLLGRSRLAEEFDYCIPNTLKQL
jgi:hypothetical protein